MTERNDTRVFPGALNGPILPDLPRHAVGPLGMALQQPPQQHQGQLPHELLVTLIVCLMMDKGESSDLGQAYIRLIEERHREFHIRPRPSQLNEVKMSIASGKEPKNMPDSWRACNNPTCVEAQRLLERLTNMDITFNQFTLQRAIGKNVDIKGQAGNLRISVQDPAAPVPAVSSIILS